MIMSWNDVEVWFNRGEARGKTVYLESMMTTQAIENEGLPWDSSSEEDDEAVDAKKVE